MVEVRALNCVAEVFSSLAGGREKPCVLQAPSDFPVILIPKASPAKIVAR